MSEEFFDRFSNESQTLLLPIFKEFAMRFKTAITLTLADNTLPNRQEVAARFVERISTAMPIAVGDAEQFVTQQAPGDYETFKTNMINAYTASLERQFNELRGEENEPIVEPTDEEFFERFGLVREYAEGGENLTAEGAENIAENTQQ